MSKPKLPKKPFDNKSPKAPADQGSTPTDPPPMEKTPKGSPKGANPTEEAALEQQGVPIALADPTRHERSDGRGTAAPADILLDGKARKKKSNDNATSVNVDDRRKESPNPQDYSYDSSTEAGRERIRGYEAKSSPKDCGQSLPWWCNSATAPYVTGSRKSVISGVNDSLSDDVIVIYIRRAKE